MSQPQDAYNYSEAVTRSLSIQQADHTAAGNAAAHELAEVNHLIRVAALDHTYSRASGAVGATHDQGGRQERCPG